MLQLSPAQNPSSLPMITLSPVWKTTHSFVSTTPLRSPSVLTGASTEIEPDDWSDSDEDEEFEKPEPPKDLPSATRRIQALQRKLEQAKKDLLYYRQFVSERLNLAGLTDEVKKSDASSSSTHVAVPLRDDDSHYFQSYAENGMHALPMTVIPPFPE